MGLKFYSAILGIVVIAGFSLIIYFGMQPRPVGKINLSTFESTEILADAVLMRLREEIMKSPVLFLGIQPDNKEHLKIWQKFIEKNQDPKMKYSVIVIDKFLSENGRFSKRKLSNADPFLTTNTNWYNCTAMCASNPVFGPYAIHWIVGCISARVRAISVQDRDATQ